MTEVRTGQATIEDLLEFLAEWSGQTKEEIAMGIVYGMTQEVAGEGDEVEWPKVEAVVTE